MVRIDYIVRTYAVGVLSLPFGCAQGRRQSGTFYFSCVRFFRAMRGKTGCPLGDRMNQ